MWTFLMQSAVREDKSSIDGSPTYRRIQKAVSERGVAL